MKTYAVIFADASHEVTIRVNANTELEAGLLAAKEYKKENGWNSPVLRSVKEIKREKKENEYYVFSDGWFTYYVNVVTGEKKLRLDEGDVCVERNLDDFCRN